ncbi:hypothetical protein NEMBOFW57_001156 [Staphylotrichum longicolle]|uniref:DNA-directed RNA polymerase II subunit RPB9-like zinc ribbon domain-containing protein n=1 Tax=Staphylotrichum longicolle TaxID=669026 RepID=A0AAD4F1A1_9PEZI|nr:hypothetical protein NEMBOFW57_001156 [Staphylotrichum longicolle]
MSSPAASTSGDRKKPAEQITFRFCSECSNMLYPKEDEVDRKLMFTCRTCNFSEEATSSCIFRNTMNNAAGETAGVTQDVGSDPTPGTPELELDEASSTMGFDQDVDMDDDDELDVDLDDVEIVSWTGESLDELGALMSRTEDFFGLRDIDLGLEEKAENILVGAALKSSVASALAQG